MSLSIESVDWTFLNLLAFIVPPLPVTTQEAAVRKGHEERILKDVFAPSRYDKTKPPVEPVQMIPFLHIDHVERVDEEQQLIYVHGALRVAWRDPKATWNGTEYGGVWGLTRSNGQLGARQPWRPSIHLTEMYYKSANVLAAQNDVEISINAHGLISAQLAVSLKAACLFSFDGFPRDYLNCSMTIYTPLQFNSLRFQNFSGGWYYDTKGRIRAGEYRMLAIEYQALTLLGANRVVTNTDGIPARMIRSVGRYNIVFQREAIYYNVRLVLPLLSVMSITYMACLLRGRMGVVCVLVCLAVQLIHAENLADQLPPDYTHMPNIAVISTLLFLQSAMLLMARLALIYRAETLSKEELERDATVEAVLPWTLAATFAASAYYVM